MNLKKEYRTRNGLRVINLNYVPYNSAGSKVTFPIKGNLVVKESEGKTKIKTQYHLWREDGRHCVLNESGLDLILE